MTTPSPNDRTLPAGPAPTDELEADVCVVGGGMAGLCAALASARNGARTILLQDRSVLGGNASSEVRMWICGAHGADNKETGILEELLLANIADNPTLRYAMWDTVLWAKATHEERLTTILSCAVCQVGMEGDRIDSVTGWHLTRQRWLRVKAKQFIDCSGDSVLRLSGARCRSGREGSAEFNEGHAPETADRLTMGNSILLQLREVDPASHVPFQAPAWAHRFAPGHHRLEGAKPRNQNFWWQEVGGTSDTITDADAIRDELLRIAYGSWAYIKNHPDGRGKGWELEWIGMLPGKRENIRYVGDHVLTQRDVETCGVFPDVVAHGGWSMDDHHPQAFNHPGEPTIFHPAPSPYGIPYRCMYSVNIANLFFAGRNLSATHMAMSSTRVMATCATMGQAVGTAAALAVRHGVTPRGVDVRELQNTLMDDDQWLPDRVRPVPSLTRGATIEASHGDPEALRDGLDRRCRGAEHAWVCPPGGHVTLRFAKAERVQRVRIVGDSKLHLNKRMPCSIPRDGLREELPEPLPRDLRVLALDADGTTWKEVARIADNARRLIVIPLDVTTTAIRIVVDRAWGGESARLFAVDAGLPARDAAPEILPWPVAVVSKSHGA